MRSDGRRTLPARRPAPACRAPDRFKAGIAQVDRRHSVARWEIEKVAAAHLLEALRVALDHLRDFTMTGQAPEMGASRNASATYAQVRRLRTYLQRCVSAYTEIVELDLNEEDQNLLAACAIFEVANLDRKLNGPSRPGSDENAWMEERRRALTHWAVSFATRRIEHIPVADESLFLTASVQALLREIQRRVVAENQRSGVHRLTRETAGAPTVPAAPPAPMPAAAYADPYAGRMPPTQQHPQAAPPGYVDPAWAHAQAVPAPGYDPYYSAHPPPQDPRLAAAPPPAAYYAPPDELRRGPSGREFGIPPPPHGAPARPAAAGPGYPSAAPGYQASRPAYAPAPSAPAPAVHAAPGTTAPDAALAQDPTGGLDLEPRKLHDPRVRGLMLLDLRGYERALRANDHRMCVVHLGSVLEASCIDYALAHRRDLALNGAPETWNLEVVVRRVLGEDISSMDRALLFHLAAARNLLRPAIQLSNPMVVTAATQAELTQFVRRVLTAMGYTGAAEPAAPPPAASPMAAGAPAGLPPAPPPRPSSPGLPGWLRGS
jgi:hypothetical protein